jgi:putative Mn2+ efflux pump MntP
MMLLAMQVSHFTAATIFAFFASIVFGITQRSTSRDMLRYGAYCFGVFIVGMFVAGWIMWLLHH